MRDAAVERINWLYDEFPNVAVTISGGKDSTVVMELTIEVARERGRLPVPVMWLDQEAEWRSTVEEVRRAMRRPEVAPYWLQVPFRIFNATSPFDPWLNAWGEGLKWMRPKEPDSIHENIYGTDRFSKMFSAWLDVTFPDEPACNIAGVRCEESPARTLGLTIYETYKGETWGKKSPRRKDQFDFYPLYDWRTSDVWKAIHDGRWSYNSLYDSYYQHGVPTTKMRVSNLHHVGALEDLLYVQIIEPDTWDALTERLAGINTTGQLDWHSFKVGDLPPMFSSWIEYRDYLLDHLVTDDVREKMRDQFARADARYDHDPKVFQRLVQTQIACILINDYHGMKMTVFEAANIGKSKNRGVRSGRTTIE